MLFLRKIILQDKHTCAGFLQQKECITLETIFKSYLKQKVHKIKSDWVWRWVGLNLLLGQILLMSTNSVSHPNGWST